jgi:hypothetical protein
MEGQSMNRLWPAALAALSLALVPAAVAAAPPGQWGGTAEVSKQGQVTTVVVEPGEYAFLNVPQLTGKTMAQVGALSFDSLAESRIGAGAPRYSLVFDNGVTLFPSALYCQDTLADGTIRADFLDESDCLIYGSTGGPMTWSQWAEQLGDAEITFAGLVLDEAGTYELTSVVARPL